MNFHPVSGHYQLTEEEKHEVVTKCDHLSKLKYSPYLPYVFTEHGAVMLATVLNSDKANKMSVFIVRAFIELRNILSKNGRIARKIEEIENQVDEHGKAINMIVSAVQHLLNESKKPLPPLKEIKGFRNE